ncbi:3170_t:CDS:1, partial [Racocetra persica]
MINILPNPLTNKDPNLKNAFLLNEFNNSNSEFEYRSADDDDILDDETTSYASGNLDRNNNDNNIDTFVLDKLSFENARLFAENDEISCDNFWEEDDDELEKDSAFSTELESASNLTHDESIVLEDSNLIANNT